MKVEVDAEYLSNLRSLQTIVACSDDDVIAQLEGNAAHLLRELDAAVDQVHPIDSISEFSDIPRLIGLVSDDDYRTLSEARLILSKRVREYERAMQAVNAWSGSHEQGAVYSHLRYRMALEEMGCIAINQAQQGRATPEWCTHHPDDDLCPEQSS